MRVRKPVAGSYPGNTAEPEPFRAFLIRADQVIDSNEVIMDVAFATGLPERGCRLILKGVPAGSPALLDKLRLTLLDNGSKCSGRLHKKHKGGLMEVELFLGTRSINADLCAIL